MLNPYFVLLNVLGDVICPNAFANSAPRLFWPQGIGRISDHLIQAENRSTEVAGGAVGSPTVFSESRIILKESHEDFNFVWELCFPDVLKCICHPPFCDGVIH